MPIARPHTVLFDLDGTLVDTIPLIVASYQHALASVLGRGEDERVIRSWIGRTLRERFAELAPDRAEELYEAYTSWNLAHTSELLRPIDGVPELLKALGVAGIATGVVTSKRRATALLALDGASLSDLIPVLATMLDTVRHKPLPDPLLHGLSVLGALAEGAIYVGDAVA